MGYDDPVGLIATFVAAAAFAVLFVDLLVLMWRRRRRDRFEDGRPPDVGQALVELALVMPVMLLLVLGGIEVAHALELRSRWQDAASTMAGYVVANDGRHSGSAWADEVDGVAARVECDNPVAHVTFPDGSAPGDPVTLVLTCRYHPLTQVMDWHADFHLTATAAMPPVVVVPPLPTWPPMPS